MKKDSLKKFNEIRVYYRKHAMQILHLALMFLTVVLIIAVVIENNRITAKEKKKVAEEATTATAVKETENATSAASTQVKKTVKKKISTDPKDIFKNAVFIGDSRTEGFYYYSDITKYCDHFLVHKGLSVSDFGTEKFAGKKGNQTVYDALKGKKYDKVFLMQGLNELGWPSAEQFAKSYKNAIEKIQKLLPDATIYVQQIIQVSKEKSEKDQYFNKARVDEWNRQIKPLCDGEKVVWINLNDKLTDEEGYLKKDASTDGIHLKKEYCQIWLNELIDFFKEESKKEQSDANTEESTEESTKESTKESVTTTEMANE